MNCPLLISMMVAYSTAMSYQDLLLRDLYNLANEDDVGSQDDIMFENRLDNRAGDWSDISYRDILGNAHIRDPEYEENSPIWGYQYVSGGAGEGSQHLKPAGDQQNNQEVKSDKILPAYCNPGNPCPKGYNAKDDNCVENYENTAENNKHLQEQQECACDAEHMFLCGVGTQKINTAAAHAIDTNALAHAIDNSDLGHILQLSDLGESGDESLNAYIVAKKAPPMLKKRSTHEIPEEWKIELPSDNDRLNKIIKKSLPIM